MASLTLRFVLDKRLFRDLSGSNSKLVKHRAQSPVRELTLAIRPSIAEIYPTARSWDNLYINVTNTCEKIVRQVVSLTRSFSSIKRLFRDLSGSNSKLVEHRAQSPVRFFVNGWLSCSNGWRFWHVLKHKTTKWNDRIELVLSKRWNIWTKLICGPNFFLENSVV